MSEETQSCLTCANRKEWNHGMAECKTRPAFWGMGPVWIKPEHGQDCKRFRARGMGTLIPNNGGNGYVYTQTCIDTRA